MSLHAAPVAAAVPWMLPTASRGHEVDPQSNMKSQKPGLRPQDAPGCHGNLLPSSMMPWWCHGDDLTHTPGCPVAPRAWGTQSMQPLGSPVSPGTSQQHQWGPGTLGALTEPRDALAAPDSPGTHPASTHHRSKCAGGCQQPWLSPVPPSASYPLPDRHLFTVAAKYFLRLKQ